MNRHTLIEVLSKAGRKNSFMKFVNVMMAKIERKHMSKYNDKEYAIRFYKKYRGEYLDIDNPKLFNEKIWWLKFNNRDPLITQCSDKYLVRDYVKECGLEDILTQLYGVYHTAEDVKFQEFEKEIFLKCNHGSGVNIIFDPHKKFDKKAFIKNFNRQLKHNSYYNSREWGYKDINPVIIAEEVIRDSKGNLPEDFKFLCFDGEPKLLIRSMGVCDIEGKHSLTGKRISNVYDMDYNYVPITTSFPTKEDEMTDKPINFEQMKDVARKLSEPFPHCRVDLYNVEGVIYFGEITFYHSGGCGNIEPQQWALKMGSWINLESDKVKK